MPFQKGNKYGAKSKRGKDKVNLELKQKLTDLSNDILNTINVNTLSNSDKLKLLQISTAYILPKLKSIATNIEENTHTDYQIQIINDKGEIDKIVKLEPKETVKKYV